MRRTRARGPSTPVAPPRRSSAARAGAGAAVAAAAMCRGRTPTTCAGASGESGLATTPAAERTRGGITGGQERLLADAEEGVGVGGGGRGSTGPRRSRGDPCGPSSAARTGRLVT